MTLINISDNGPQRIKGSIVEFELQLIEWLEENVGKFNVDWHWECLDLMSTSSIFSLTVNIVDDEKAFLTAMRWGS
jgi:hypothetical protein